MLPIIMLGSAGCTPAKPVCAEGSVSYVSDASLFPTAIAPEAAGSNLELQTVEIAGKEVEVNRVIHGPLCNESIQGTVYIACDVQVAAWSEHPDFFKNCDFNVEPDAVIYVAYHQNAAYYNGCASCHSVSGTTTP